MSLPTIEPLPDENTSLPPARRRRQRRTVVLPDSSDRADFLSELSRRSIPSFDFFLFSLLSGLVLGAALLFDSPALVLLAALTAPFMAPVVGLSLGTITGAMGFVLQALGSLGIGSLIVFLCGTLAGWVVPMLPEHIYQQAAYFSQFNWPDLLVLTLGAGLTTFLVVRSPNQKPLVTSVAVAYGLYLPVGTAGFGLTSGLSEQVLVGGLTLFLVHFIWAAFIGALVLGFLGIRPLNTTGYILTAVYAVSGIAAVLFILSSPLANLTANTTQWSGKGTEVSAGESVPLPSPSPSISISVTPSPIPLTPTPTRTLVPSRTPTITVSPVPTPVWARISAEGGDGALIREDPGYDSPVVQSILNGTLVEVLPGIHNNEGVDWVHIKTIGGKDGWIVQSLIRTATPVP